ncbi:MAG: PAS domain-containing protein [Chitinophagaceae bacterium]|nr:PAS domain-containing protein [Chitinophagaceae bacterium]
MNRIISTIQQKIMRIVLITSGVVVLLTCVAFVGYQFYEFRQNARSQLSTLGDIIAANSTAALAFEDHDAAVEILEALKAEKHIVAACLYDTSGKIFAQYPDTISVRSLPQHPGPHAYQYRGTFLEGFQAVVQSHTNVGTLYLKSDLKVIYETFFKYALIGLVIFLSAVLVAYILSRRLQRKVSLPIQALSKTAAIVSQEKNYSERAKKYDNDELGLLTDTFNKMLDQIQFQNEEITLFSQSLEMKVAQRTEELNQANRELLLNTEFSETIINSSVDVIAVFDTEMKFVLLNTYGRKMYSVTADEVLGKHLLTVFPQLKDGQMYHGLKKALRGESVNTPYYKSLVSDTILENFFIPLLDSDHRVYSVLVIGHDITEAIAVSEKLKEVNTHLEASNRELEQFAYIASHDLQEPLRKIQVYSSNLERNLDDQEASRKNIAKVVSAASRMSNLIKAILNYSRLTNEEQKVEKVDLNEIVQNILSDYELLISQKEATLKADLLPEITGNRIQLNQLFSNLLSNSLKFSKDKPQINISSTILAGDSITQFNNHQLSNQYVVVAFQDNGIGFHQQHAEKIFDVFQRLHNKQAYEGTGIGLSICKKIIDNHNGHITVKSKPDEGTTFTIYLPLYQ